MASNEFNHAANPEKPATDKNVTESELYRKIELYEKLSVDDGKAQALLQKERNEYGDNKQAQADKEGKQNVSLKLGLSTGVLNNRNTSLTERNHEIQRQANINKSMDKAKDIYRSRVSLSGKFNRDAKEKDDLEIDMEK